MTLLALEVLSPFYMFQIASIMIWTFNQYYYYIIALVAMSCSGIVTSVVQTRQVRIRTNMIFQYSFAIASILNRYIIILGIYLQFKQDVNHDMLNISG